MSTKIGIYKITNLVNNKIYIGKSITVNYRWSKHLWCLRRNCHINKHLQSSFNKYGEENFSYNIIEECESVNLNDREKYWVSYLDSSNPLYGYNKTKGGDGLIATNEIKAKISKSLIGKKHSIERRLNQSISHKGKKLSEKTKLNQSISQRKRYSKNCEIDKLRIAMSKNSILQLDNGGNIIGEFLSIREAERETGVHSSTISRVCRNLRKSAGGFIWKFKSKQY